MHKVLKFLYTEIAYNGHLQTLSSLALVIFSSMLLEIEITWDSLLILYLSLYFIYLYNRYKELDIDQITNRARTDHLKKFEKKIPLILFINFLLVSALLLFFANFIIFLFVLAIIVFGLLYTVYFKKLTRKVFLFKNYYVAFTAAILVFYPIIYYSFQLSHALSNGIALAVFVFLRTMQMQIILDLKDIEGDRREKLLTMGVLWGKEKILNFLKFSSIITAGLVPILIFLFLDITPAILILPVFIIQI